MKPLYILLVISYLIGVNYAQIDWESGNFYQVYPRSFMDSNNDGVGDLQGIKSKLQYIKDLGMDGVWLSPIFKSPMADHGYDISDFRDIHHEFGTMKDFDELQLECRKLGLKLILDFVPNHSSDQHEWFKRSERREPGFEDYYIWHPGRIHNITGIRSEPTNWIGAFKGSAWQWSPIRNEFYYHKFLSEQPDLNYRNQKVADEMKEVLNFWFDKGVDGFRIDTIPHLFEVAQDTNGNLPDEPLSGNPGCTPDDSCYLNHPYTEDQPETYDMVYQWRELFENYQKRNGGDTKVIMTESYSPLEKTLKYYGDGNREGSHIPFNFEMIMRTNDKSTARIFKDTAELWLRMKPRNKPANWVMGNHDQQRIASRLGLSRGDLINIMLQTLPGIAITYQGEELVMENVNISWEDTRDPQACRTDPNTYYRVSRDPARTPFPWDNSTNAGFSNATRTWLPVGDNYKKVNVRAQLEAPNSHLKIFKKLVQLKKYPVMKSGDYVGLLLNNENVYAYKREFGRDMVFIVLNFGKTNETINLRNGFGVAPMEMLVYTSSLDSGLNDRDKVNTTKITLKPDHGLVLTQINGPTRNASSASSFKVAIICMLLSVIIQFL